MTATVAHGGQDNDGQYRVAIIDLDLEEVLATSPPSVPLLQTNSPAVQLNDGRIVFTYSVLSPTNLMGLAILSADLSTWSYVLTDLSYDTIAESGYPQVPCRVPQAGCVGVTFADFYDSPGFGQDHLALGIFDLSGGHMLTYGHWPRLVDDESSSPEATQSFYDGSAVLFTTESEYIWRVDPLMMVADQFVNLGDASSNDKDMTGVGPSPDGSQVAVWYRGASSNGVLLFDSMGALAQDFPTSISWADFSANGVISGDWYAFSEPGFIPVKLNLKTGEYSFSNGCPGVVFDSYMVANSGVTVSTILPRLRQFPRDDSLGGAPRQFASSRSVQNSPRVGWSGAYR